MRNKQVIENLLSYLEELRKKRNELKKTGTVKEALTIQEVEDMGLQFDLASSLDEFQEVMERIKAVKGKIELLTKLTHKKFKQKVENGDQIRLVNHTHEIDFVLTDKSELVDLERHIYSIFSTLGKTVLGKKYGEKVTLNNTEYDIVPS